MEKSISKLKMLKIWEILVRETDEDNPMTSTELMSRLEAMGISCDRRTLYKDIDALNENGYEVLCNRSKKNEYYVLDRKFDDAELHILIDAVQAASFVTEKKTSELVNKIAGLSGSHRAQILKSNAVAFNTVKIQNEKIYYSVNEIITAINAKKKIEFYYFDYGVDGKRIYRRNKQLYWVNPYATIFSNDCYYLLCYDDKHEKMSHYRIDRMDSVTISQRDIKKRDDLADFNVKKHKKQVFSMFAGEDERVTFQIDKCLIDGMFDKFGSMVRMKELENGCAEFSVDVQLSPAFIGWCLSFGSKLKVIQPPYVAERVKEQIESLRQAYEEN
jgi:predicted DNA-binding transcriptional regulator YafY